MPVNILIIIKLNNLFNLRERINNFTVRKPKNESRCCQKPFSRHPHPKKIL